MRGPSPLLAVAAMVVLAGCAALPGPAKSASSPTADAVVSVGSAVGNLRIVVVDPAVRPLAQAVITFNGRIPGGPWSTNANGELTLAGVEPGVYGFHASKAGYFPAAATATAAEGDPAPAVLVLELDAGQQPYAELVKFDGMVGCSTGLGPGQGTLNPCVLTSNVATALCDSYGQCFDDPTGANPWFTVPIASPPTFHQAETVWDPTVGTATKMGTLAYAGTAIADMTLRKAVRSSEAPMTLSANETELREWKTGAGNILRYYWMGADDVGSVTLQQPFSSFLTSTYRFVPPPGWTFVQDGPAVPPS